jgi:glycosyltransferase involved in cell wall biosynthesis
LQDPPELSVVIPVYDEGDNLRPLVRELTEVLRGIHKTYEVIAVDDGSTDKSFDILRELALKDSGLRVIRFRHNCGQTAAFDAGFKAARGKIVVTMDADLQNDPKDVPVLLERLSEYDAVCGWRYKRNDP